MTQFQRLLKTYKNNLERGRVDRKVAKYVCSCFQYGRSIKCDKILLNSLDNFLVDLEPTKNAIQRVKDCLEDIEYSQEWLFVIGDYGSGKTQLKDRIGELVDQRDSSVLVNVSANLQIDSLEDFTNKFIDRLKNLVMREHKEKYNEFIQLFEEYGKKNLKLEDNTRIVTKIIQKGIEIGLNFLIQLDELDQLTNMESFHPWASFVAKITDLIYEGILVIVYISEREINRFWNKDKRLIRTYTAIARPLDPGTRFGSKYLEGIANVLSIYQVANNFRYKKESVELLESFLAFHKKRLMNFGLRRFNTGAFLLAQMLQDFEKNELWQKIKKVKQQERSDIGHTAERCLINTINGTQFNFNFEGEKYTAEITSERVEGVGWRSDGRIVVLKEVERDLVEEMTIAIEIKYTTKSNHATNQLKKVEKIATNQPIVFYSIGVDENNRKKIEPDLKELSRKIICL